MTGQQGEGLTCEPDHCLFRKWPCSEAHHVMESNPSHGSRSLIGLGPAGRAYFLCEVISSRSTFTASLPRQTWLGSIPSKSRQRSSAKSRCCAASGRTVGQASRPASHLKKHNCPHSEPCVRRSGAATSRKFGCTRLICLAETFQALLCSQPSISEPASTAIRSWLMSACTTALRTSRAFRSEIVPETAPSTERSFATTESPARPEPARQISGARTESMIWPCTLTGPLDVASSSATRSWAKTLRSASAPAGSGQRTRAPCGMPPKFNVVPPDWTKSETRGQRAAR